MIEHTLETRTIDTAGAAMNTIINRRPTAVHWITFSPETLKTQGLLQIYNGTDVNSELVWQIEPGQANHCNFSKEIHCPRGCFIYNAATIASYTVGYKPISDAPFEASDAE